MNAVHRPSATRTKLKFERQHHYLFPVEPSVLMWWYRCRLTPVLEAPSSNHTHTHTTWLTFTWFS